MTPARLVACGFGSGLVPIAAGTVGSFCAVVIGAGLMLVSPYALPAAAVAATLGGVLAVRACGAANDDPGWVVIDEFAGVFITMLALPGPGALGLVSAFLLFRFFDITKLGPIGWADRQKNAFGVMGDDVMAGVISAVILWGVQRVWPGVFG